MKGLFQRSSTRFGNYAPIGTSNGLLGCEAYETERRLVRDYNAPFKIERVENLSELIAVRG